MLTEPMITHNKTAAWRKLTPKQRAFCEQYLILGDAKKAALEVGYAQGTASVAKTALLDNPNIGRAIGILMKERSQKTMIEACHVLEELGVLGFFNVKELFDELGNLKEVPVMSDSCGHAISSITQKVDATLNISTTIKLHNKLPALQMLAQHLGMLIDRKELTGKDGAPLAVGTGIPKELTVEEWEKKYGGK